MRRIREKKQTRKKPEIIEYFKFKGRLTLEAFIEVLNQAGIDMEPHEGQWEIIDAYEERVSPSEAVLKMAQDHGIELDFEYKYRCLVGACGRRFGKSVVASLLGACEMLIPYARVLIVSYTLDNCEVIFKQIRQLIIGLLGPDEVVADRQKDMELELKNGATLRVASNDNVQSKLGTAISLLIIDEAKLFNRKLYEQVLMPMLFDYAPYSRSILISSPEAGWFETYYKWGQDEKREKYWSINLPTHTNPTIPKEELDKMERDMPRDLYEQEVLGLFTSNAGLVCKEFDKKIHVYDPHDYLFISEWISSGNPVINMVDSGYSHYFASIWVLYVEELDTFFAIGEYWKNKTLTTLHAKAIKDFEDEWGFESAIRYADPAASQQIADFAEHNLHFNKASKVLRETVINLNTLFFQKSEVTGKPRLLISKDCPELIRQLSSVIWKTGKEDEQTREAGNATGVKPFLPDKEGPSGGGARTDWDVFDAFRYGMYSFTKNSHINVSVLSLGAEEEEMDPFDRQLMEAGYVKVSLLN
jgi:hypothetical protein